MTTGKNGNDAVSTSQALTCRALVVGSRNRLAVSSGGPKRRFARFASGDSAPQRRAPSEVRAAFESAGVAFNGEDAPGTLLRQGS